MPATTASQPERNSNALADGMSLYVHIPFCQTKCPYCDFNTYSNIEALIPSYAGSLAREIQLWGDSLGSPRVNTLFFGGGTPSYLPAEAIGSVTTAVRDAFKMAPDAEFTVEANPGDLNHEHLLALLNLGINRLSIGVQSLDDSLLDVLGRRHSSEEAVEAYLRARQVGFNNVSIDLMYGISYQSMEQWRSTLDRVMSLSPEHLSIYCLALEEGTPMERQISQGEMPQPDPDLAADMYLLAEELLEKAGYRHYEISNWAMPGKESRHNLTYWLNKPYLGVGPGAHSYLGNWRFYNIKSPREYVRRLTDAVSIAKTVSVNPQTLGQMPIVEDIETIEDAMEMAETLMLGLRLEGGVDQITFAKRFGKTISSVYGEQVRELTSFGLLEETGGALRLTGKGRLLGNEVFLRFFDWA